MKRLSKMSIEMNRPVYTMVLYLFLAISILANCKCDDVLNEKIVIVGGGASGIAAASKLLEYGYENIVILEAENRIGGRIWTECEDNKCLELGAQWIMGDKGNVAFDLAQKAGVVGNKFEDYGNLFVKSNGESISNESIYPYWKLYDEILTTFDNKNDTISELLKNHIEQIDTSKLDKDTITHFFKLLVESITPVTDWNLETGKGLKTFETIEGSTAINLNTGMHALLRILMGTFPDNELSAKWKSIIHLESEVKNISWNQPKPIVQYSTVLEPNKVETIEAEHVIVTVPLGVLKEEYQNLFVPALPEKKVNAINSLSYGFVNKVFLTFDRQWWPNNTNLFIIWNENDIHQLKNSDKWLSNIVGIFPERNYEETLSAWFVEKDNISSETNTDTELYSKLITFIKKVFANQGWTIDSPIKSKRTKWQHNPNFRGSYSFRGLNASKNIITNADLKESLKNERGKHTVLFAGEATHDKYYSTVHGAIESGFAAADEIVDIHKNLS